MPASTASPSAANRDVIAIGASAGGVETLTRLARGLPSDLPASVLVVLHRDAEGPELLSRILDDAGPLHAAAVRDGQRLEHGRIYVAPPDRHLLVGGDSLQLRRGPRENRARPAIDPLFRSAAVSCSSRVTGVLLTGRLNDGTSGLLAIRRCGGLAVVQDPSDAAFAEMPRNALAHVAVDHVLPVGAIAPALAKIAASPRPPSVEPPEHLRIEALIAAQELTVMPDQQRLGPISPLTCPDCHGAMVEIVEQGLIRYRCHTGHAFTLEVLQLAQSEAWERTLYAAERAQQEQAMLSRRLAEAASGAAQARWLRRARDYEAGAGLQAGAR